MSYGDIFSLFNQTITALNDSANSQYYDTINEINTIQNQSIDPSDMGAYNLTMYGMNSIHDIQSHVIGPLGQLQHIYGQIVNQYNVPYNSSTLQLSQNVTTGGNPISPILSNPSSLLPTNNIIAAAALLLIGFAIGRSVFSKR